jgi:RecA/RadA recombinase
MQRHHIQRNGRQNSGVDSNSLIYSPAKTINDMVDVAVQLMEAEVDLIVVDSISALLPAIYFEKDGEMN